MSKTEIPISFIHTHVLIPYLCTHINIQRFLDPSFLAQAFI